MFLQYSALLSSDFGGEYSRARGNQYYGKPKKKKGFGGTNLFIFTNSKGGVIIPIHVQS